MHADINICKKCERFALRAQFDKLVPYYSCDTPGYQKLSKVYFGPIESFNLTTGMPDSCKYKMEQVILNQGFFKRIYLWIVWRIRRVC